MGSPDPPPPSSATADRETLQQIAAGDALERLVGLGRRAARADVVAAVLGEGADAVVCCSGRAAVVRPEGLARAAGAGALPLVVDDAGRATEPVRAALAPAGLRACIVLPLGHGGALLGRLLAGMEDSHAWSASERTAVGNCARAIEEHLAQALGGPAPPPAAERERRYREMALEQAALRRVATVVARSSTPDEVYGAVCRELAALAGVPMSAVSRFRDGESSEVLATEGIGHDPAHVLCCALWERGTGAAAERYRRGQSIHFDDTGEIENADARRYAEHGIRSLVGAPVFVSGELWGAVTVGSTEPHAVSPGEARRLERFAELVGLAVADAETRRQLSEQASTDPLTGLVNHRRFHEELQRETTLALRHGWPLAVVMLDVDRFKEVNDSLGHLAGDELLRAVAATLRAEVRDGEIVARLGGDEFAVVLPGTDAEGAVALARRVRAALAGNPAVAATDVTVSAGVSDLEHAVDAESLVRLADGALYWAKEQGRDDVWRYAPDVILSLSERERAERLARTQALTALRALARAQDLRDPSTRRHAERVATLAQRIAERLNWRDADGSRLREAALLHDIGKIAVSDAILHKPGPLGVEELAVVKTHAALGAEIVGEALDAEQVLWVLHHHERWDGGGYPAGLDRTTIPAGAQIIAVADAFDVMTTARHYREPVAEAEALAECRRECGRQFAPDVVRALHEVLGAEDALPSVA